MKYIPGKMDAVLREHKRWLEESPFLVRRMAGDIPIPFERYRPDTEIKNDDKKYYHLRADFTNCEINRYSFINVDLRGANFQNAHLDCCIFYNSNVRFTLFTDAKFENCEFYNMTIFDPCLNLSNFIGCKFYNCSLHGTEVAKARINGCAFYDCQFISISAENADFENTVLINCGWLRPFLNVDKCFDFKKPPIIWPACPPTGAFVGWKKCKPTSYPVFAEAVIVKLQIPASAKRSHAFGLKCRCNKAKVLAIESLSGDKLPENITAVSNVDSRFVYKVGKMVSVDNFDENRFHECAPGIHFFMDRDDAVAYEL